ncbi:MAG: hypothetical protein LUF78_10825 [Clostridiales bacterium]|nr:hypothetical protein [Clostridiales bacterium]
MPKEILIREKELFNEATQEFYMVKATTLRIEHSLISLQKWESKWHKPFLVDEEKTLEQTIDYIRCMTLNTTVDPMVYQALTPQNINEINDYINDPMTATWFKEEKGGRKSREIITAERIYYWMIALNIPSEYKKWHLNQLMTLIRVCDIENRPKKKMRKGELMRRNSSLNASRKKALHTKG